MKPLITMRAALGEPDLFASIFAGASWDGWRILLIAIMGEALTPSERVIFESLTGRAREPGEPCEEVWAIIGPAERQDAGGGDPGGLHCGLMRSFRRAGAGRARDAADHERVSVADWQVLSVPRRRVLGRSRVEGPGREQDLGHDQPLERRRHRMPAGGVSHDPGRDGGGDRL